MNTEPRVTPTPTTVTDFGSAVTIVIQLTNFELYGLRDRNSFHLELLRDGRLSSSDGIASILECVSTKPFHKFDKLQRRLFKRALRKLSLPLRASPQTRLYFGYEATRMAFVVDASPTVTSTFGFSSHSSSCCPIDRLVPMARDYFTALIKEIPCQNSTWSPKISISVVAVYPKDESQCPTSLLIRDYQIVDLASAELLLEKLEEWCSGEVESEIAKRLGASKGILPVNASSMHDLLDAGHAAVASLSSASRPCVLIATDCRSLACDSIIDVTSELYRVDVPVSVLDLSSSQTNMKTEAKSTGASSMSDDPSGAIFPLHLSNDSEVVSRLCQATNGAYWNASLLAETAKTKAGHVPVSSPLNPDHFFTFRRHTLLANAVQWYTLIELSPLSPVPQPEWGRLSANLMRPSRKQLQARTMLQNYEVNPAPLHDILLLRIKQGYNAKQCVSGDTDRFSIHLTLQLDFGTIIHYELSYNAKHPLYGLAQVKMELSGDSTFVLAVKHDFDHGRSGRRVTVMHHLSARICTHALAVRKEDFNQASLSPIKWPALEQVDAPGSAFLHRLSSLSREQHYRHFSEDEFECVCRGRMPWEETDSSEQDSDGQLIECIRTWCNHLICDGVFIKIIDQQCGVGGYLIVKLQRCASASRLFTLNIGSFASTSSKRRQGIIAELKGEIQKLHSVEILPKQMARYLVGHKSQDKTGQDFNANSFMNILESQYCHESWDLVKDVELIPLVMRRRKEVGKFILLESNEKHTLFAKLIGRQDENLQKDPGTQVQYKLSVLDDKVVADLHMECESQVFFPLRQQTSKFHALHRNLRTREKECARALQCRTTILKTIATEDCNNVPGVLLGDSLASCVRRLLTYASVTSLSLRFFGTGNEAGNRCLRDLTVDSLMVPSPGLKVASLAVRDGGTGDWFGVQHDKETLSLVHLSQLSATDNGLSNVRVDIHTVSLDQMYRKHDDGEEANADVGYLTGTKHGLVARFRDQIESAHKRHFARAAYLSLLIDESQEFDTEDFEEVLSVLEFIEATAVSISGDSTNQRNLPDMLAKVLTPVAIVPGLFVFKRADDLEWSSLHDEHDDNMTESVFSQGENFDNSECENCSADSFEETNRGSAGFDSPSISSSRDENENAPSSPPVFVRFLKDGEAVDQNELMASNNSTRITVLLSVFSSATDCTAVHKLRKVPPENMPKTHADASFQITTLLRAYTAEQTLERLRAYGPEIEQPSVDDARSCLRKARNVLSMTVDVYFYSTQSDSIVRSYSLAVGDTGVDEGFRLVALYLVKHQSDQKFVQCCQPNSFMAIETQNARLRYWCFLYIDKIQGVILIDLWHPEGEVVANRVMQKTVDLVAETCHQVNQHILLRHLHQSRCASDLLVESMSEANSSKAQFECDVVHNETLELYHRCAINVNKVIRTLESSVLHNFAVSNRRSLFVYKDESDSVFYLRLSPRTVHDGAFIELLVHGISTPGPSIRCHLVNLLKRRLMTIGVDYLASILTINPLYSWKQEDMHFVSSFQAMWSKVDDSSGDSATMHTNRERFYNFPKYIYDPGLVMLYLRQNVLGSSYFYPVISGENLDQDKGEFLSTTIHDDTLYFNGSKFVLYFNASRSKLHPEMQAENTLTELGAALARKAGSGLALVTISLDCDSSTKLAVPLSDVEDEKLFDSELIRLRGDGGHDEHETSTICVSITNTTLHREASLHDLIQLCFNQVIVAWTIERNLERIQGKPKVETQDHSNLPGLPHMSNMLESGSRLPHPAIQVVEMTGMIRSSSVASCLSELLRSIIDEFPQASKQLLADQKIARKSRDGKSSIVRLESSSMKQLTETPNDRDEKTMELLDVIDSPIDCPEYAAFFSTGDHALSALDDKEWFPKVFSDVAVPMTHESGIVISDYKKMHLRPFRRSLAYILVVKRNVRKLYAYNWNSKIIKQVSAKMKEINKANIWRAGKMTETSLSECMGSLAPALVVSSKQGQRPTTTDFNDTVSITSDSDKEGAQFRMKRNQPIRRPKLVGKSVEGSAAQAVALSRARARFQPQQLTKTVPNASTAKPTLHTDQPKKGKSYQGTDEREGVSRMKRNLVAKINQYVNDSVASVHCSYYQHAAKAMFQRGKGLNPRTVEFFFRSGALSWIEVAESPTPFQSHAIELLQDCATLLCRSMTELSIVVLDPSSESIIFLRSKIRTVSQCRCFELIKLEVEKLENDCVRFVAVGRVLRVERRPDIQKRFISQYGKERDATAFRILASNQRFQFLLKANAFDSVMVKLANVAESPSKHPQKTLDYLNLLADGCALQPVALKSAYKCCQLELKLSSYGDQFVSLYPCAVLMEWLSDNASSRNLHRCSAQNLLFRREVTVNSTISILFISPGTNACTESVIASVLCNTAYQDIERLTKSDKFDFMVTTFDLIAYEIAGVVFKELLYAARAIRQGELWEMFSVGQVNPSHDNCIELLQLCCKKSVLEVLSNHDRVNVISLFERCLPSRMLQEMMAKNETFQPHNGFQWDTGTMIDVYFLSPENLFLLICSNHDRTSYSILLLDRVPISSTNPDVLACLQKLSNFMLHWLWKEVVSGCP